MESKHTPGPWVVIEGQKSTRVASEPLSDFRGVVARLYRYAHRGKAVALANARLIAAAPDLLVALRTLRPYVESCAEPDLGNDSCPAVKDLRQIDAAIAKAEGKEAPHGRS